MLWRHIGQEGLPLVRIVTAHVQHRLLCPHGTSTQLGVSTMHTAHMSPLEWETNDGGGSTRPARAPRAAGGTTLHKFGSGATLLVTTAIRYTAWLSNGCDK